MNSNEHYILTLKHQDNYYVDIDPPLNVKFDIINGVLSADSKLELINIMSEELKSLVKKETENEQ